MHVTLPSHKETAMRLDLNSLDVQSFATSPFGDAESDIAGPSVTVPIDPETHFEPCTKQLTCVGCA